MRMALSSEFQRGEAEEREDDRENHEPRDDLRLAPADELEVVMERRHPENALPRRLERRDLDHDRRGFDHEDAADNHQYEFLLDEQSNCGEGAAEGE